MNTEKAHCSQTTGGENVSVKEGDVRSTHRHRLLDTEATTSSLDLLQSTTCPSVSEKDPYTKRSHCQHDAGVDSDDGVADLNDSDEEVPEFNEYANEKRNNSSQAVVRVNKVQCVPAN